MKKNNKGFTLVELIIVVAVIAILATVLAPQYIRYVERSRQSNDLQVAANYMRACTVAVTDLSVGTHTNDFNWFVFKWGYSTGNNDNLNMHVGVATEDATTGLPTGIDNNRKDVPLQNSIAQIMGWADENGVLDDDLIQSPQSAAAQEVGNGGNSFIFYMNTRTGEILVDKGSAAWVNEIGVNATLMS